MQASRGRLDKMRDYIKRYWADVCADFWHWLGGAFVSVVGIIMAIYTNAPTWIWGVLAFAGLSYAQFRAWLTAEKRKDQEKDRADALAEKLGSKSLEIVFQHNVHFIRQNIAFVIGGEGNAEDDYLLAIHNRSSDKEIRGVSLCIIESNKIHVHTPMLLEAEDPSITRPLRPKEYRYYRFVARRRCGNDNQPIRIHLADKSEPIIESAPAKIKVAAYARDAYCEQIFELELSSANILKLGPYCGSWSPEWGRNVTGFVSVLSSKKEARRGG
jgi:hypothetical protein